MNGSSASAMGQTPEKGTRLAAALIDGLIATVLVMLLGGIPLIGGAVGAMYLVVRDGFELGPIHFRSVGKHLMGLGLVHLAGKPVTLETSLLRNWMFGLGIVAGILAAVPIVGGLIAPIVTIGGFGIILYEVYNVFATSSGRRWGDRLGNTKVVQAQPAPW